MDGLILGGDVVNWILAILLLGAYPLALVCPMGLRTELVFQFALPVAFAMSMLCAAMLATGTMVGRHAKVAAIVVLAYSALCVAAAWRGNTPVWTDAVIMVGYLAVPLWFAVCRRRDLPRGLPWILAAVWALNLLHCVWQYTAADHEMVGLAGNRNWMAALAVATAPFAWLACRHCAWRVAVLGATAVLMWQGHCRAVWVALAAYALWLAWRYLPRMASAAIAGALCLAAVTVVAAWPDAMARAVAKDIRVPMWASTCRMIADNPVLGVGPGNYRREYVAFKSTAHRMRANAAPVTEHPHNEVLHVAACAGIPAALLFCVALLPVLVAAPSPVQFAAFVLVACAQFDKVLVEPPLCLILLVLLGILWRPVLRVRWAPWQMARLRGAVLGVAAGCAVVAGWREARTSWLCRSGFLAETRGDFAGAYRDYSAAAAVSPRRVEPTTYAGMIAGARLHDSERALNHLSAAWKLEPDFAHLNGEIARALWWLGRFDAAEPFARREMALYPAR